MKGSRLGHGMAPRSGRNGLPVDECWRSIKLEPCQNGESRMSGQLGGVNKVDTAQGKQVLPTGRAGGLGSSFHLHPCVGTSINP